MSSSSDTRDMGGAEGAFRDAFMRLKGGCPQVLPKGTPVSQNNVAREAGKDPTALKKSRFPEVVREIQAWVESSSRASVKENHRQRLAEAQARAAKLSEEVDSLVSQRDKLLSELLSAKQTIFEQWRKIQQLESLSTVRPLAPREGKHG